jgi:hypothetical protein
MLRQPWSEERVVVLGLNSTTNVVKADAPVNLTIERFNRSSIDLMKTMIG